MIESMLFVIESMLFVILGREQLRFGLSMSYERNKRKRKSG